MRRTRAWVLMALAITGSAGFGTALAAPAEGVVALQPYTARYAVTFRGIGGGEIESRFSRSAADGQWKHETRVFPSLLARVAISSQANEASTMQVTPSGVRPLSFRFDDGSTSSAKDVRLAYDWSAQQVTGVNDGQSVNIALVPGTHDTASVQAAMIFERLAGRKPTSFRIITDGKSREYRYWQEGTQQVMTPLGKVDAEVWASQRDGSNRVSKVWHAPSLGYVPVQAVQYRKGKAETQMKLVRLQR